MKYLCILSLLIHCNVLAQWTLIWSDEFNDNKLDETKWIQETGGNGWGNNESQFYTAGSINLNISQGQLTITAKKEPYGSNSYTSAKISTKGKFSTKYGKIESSIQCPQGKGLWPAFWMLGTSIDQISWPKCGEIDVMEHINSEMKIHGTAHWDNMGHQYWGGVIATDPAVYHNYSIIWDSTKIQWFMDDVIYYQLNIKNNVNGTEEFHLPFYLILNLAVGGNWPGYPDQSTIFPAEMKVDYVRVFQPDLKASTDELPESLSFYPNPTNDELYLKSNTAIFSYKIYTIEGKIIDTKNETTPIHTISLNQLSPGTYIIYIEQNNMNYRQIIQKN